MRAELADFSPAIAEHGAGESPTITKMARERKLRKSSKKCKKDKKEDKSEIVECVEEECEGSSSNKLREKSSKRAKKSSKQVHIAVLPDRYQPLEEDQGPDPVTEHSGKKKQQKYKKFRKNVGKALRYSWKCLVVGLQSFSSAYSGPLSAATTLVPEVHRTQCNA